MSTLSPSTTVKKSSVQVSTLVEGETIVLHLESGTYFSLNEVGAVVWAALDEPRTLRDLSVRVMAEYEVDEARCATDIQSLVEKLLDEKMIEVI